MIDQLVNEGLICADHKIEEIEGGAFKRPVTIICPNERFFFTDNKRRYETENQIRYRELFPLQFPEVITYGDNFSLERYHDLIGVNALERTSELAHELGEIAGMMFNIGRLVHLDAANVSRDTKTGNLMWIDTCGIGYGNIYDAIGTFTNSCVGDSDVFVTEEHPDDFIQGFAASTGFGIDGMRNLKIPNYYQLMLYISKKG